MPSDEEGPRDAFDVLERMFGQSSLANPRLAITAGDDRTGDDRPEEAPGAGDEMQEQQNEGTLIFTPMEQSITRRYGGIDVDIAGYWTHNPGGTIEILIQLNPPTTNPPNTNPTATSAPPTSHILTIPHNASALLVNQAIADMYINHNPHISLDLKQKLEGWTVGKEYIFLLLVHAFGINEIQLWKTQCAAALAIHQSRVYFNGGFMRARIEFHIQSDQDWLQFMNFLGIMRVHAIGATVQPKKWRYVECILRDI